MRSIITQITEPFSGNTNSQQQQKNQHEDSQQYWERPGTILLAEGTFLSKPSWSEILGKEFPKRGISFASTNIFPPQDDTMDKSSQTLWNPFRRCEMELTHDIESLCDPGIILITRGPIPSLVAQYYLESRALAALVMVNPFLVPFSKKELQSSANHFNQYMIEQVHGDPEFEMMNLLNNHHGEKHDIRVLRLESGSIPMLILHTSQNLFPWKISDEMRKSYADLNEINAETIAVYHSNEDGSFPPVPVICLDDNGDDQTNSVESRIAKQVYKWIDEEDIL